MPDTAGAIFGADTNGADWDADFNSSRIATCGSSPRLMKVHTNDFGIVYAPNQPVLHSREVAVAYNITIWYSSELRSRFRARVGKLRSDFAAVDTAGV